MSERSLKIAVLQDIGAPGDTDNHLLQLDRAAASAAGQGAKLLLCSELFMTGYNIGENIINLAEGADGSFCQRACEIANRSNIALIYGYPEKDSSKLFNSARIIGQNGTPIGNYRKLHLAGDFEKKFFTPGEMTTLVEIAGFKIAILICCDVEFPESVRACRNLGADLVCVSTALRQQYEHLAHRLVPTRAYENSLYVAYANHSGTEGDWRYCGASCIAAPDGTDIARAGSEGELLIATIDHSLIQTARTELPYLFNPRNDIFDAL